MGGQLYHCMEVKLNISILGIGCQNDEIQVLSLYAKHMYTKVVAGALGDEWKSSVIPVSVANDKWGFSVMQECLDP